MKLDTMCLAKKSS